MWKSKLLWDALPAAELLSHEWKRSEVHETASCVTKIKISITLRVICSPHSTMLFAQRALPGKTGASLRHIGAGHAGQVRHPVCTKSQETEVRLWARVRWEPGCGLANSTLSEPQKRAHFPQHLHRECRQWFVYICTQARNRSTQ